MKKGDNLNNKLCWFCQPLFPPPSPAYKIKTSYSLINRCEVYVTTQQVKVLCVCDLGNVFFRLAFFS